MADFKNSENNPVVDYNVYVRPRKVCLCRNLTEDQIREAVEGGAHTFEEVRSVTNCSTGCGTCEPRVRETIKKYL